MSRRIFRSVWINTILLGIFSLSQLAFEYLAARNVSVKEFETYVFHRNLFLPLVYLSSFGINEALARKAAGKREEWHNLALLALILITLVSALYAGLSGFFIPDEKKIAASVVFFTSLLWGWSQIISSVIRVEGSFAYALVVRDSWRVSAWLGYLLYWLGILDFPTSTFIMITSVFMATGAAGAFKAKKIHASAQGLKAALGEWATLLSFWLSSIFMISTSYLDQIMLGFIAKEVGVLKAYSVVVLLVVSPFLMVSIAVSYILMPLIAKEGARFWEDHLFKHLWRSLAILLAVATPAGLLYYFAVNALASYGGVTLDPYVYALLYSLAICRLAYVIPSSYVGALANLGEVNAFTAASVVIVALQMLIMYMLYEKIGPAGIAAGALFSWLSRTALGWRIMGRIYGRAADAVIR